jgi:cytochrome d ubiquinol oxidase subunit I
MLMSLISLVYLFGTWKNWFFIKSNWFRWLIVLGGPLSVLAMETGWWLDEVGRQPWILRGILRTKLAATTNVHVNTMLLLFAGLYLILGIGTVVVLTRMFRKNTVEQELEDRGSKIAGDTI